MTSTRRRTPPVAAVLPLFAALLAAPATAAGKPMKVYVLAGQSNMEGQAVVDLDGKDYNDGKGTLVALLAEPTKAAGLAHLKAANGTWRVRDDVWMWYQPEAAPLQAGPLAVGYMVYGDQHHFGPELEFGHVVGAAVENEVLLVKTAWGGKSLFADFRPPQQPDWSFRETWSSSPRTSL